jgi:hypothetical protein
MGRKYFVRLILGVVTLIALAALIGAMYFRYWEAATTCATLLVGLIAADVVVWQGYVIKRQLAFSTYLDLDKEWNSKAMMEARQTVHAPGTDDWDHSRLEAVLEFFEKLASLFKLAGDMPLIYESTLGWYAVRYFLLAREHGQIEYLQNLWKDNLYQDLKDLYAFYLRAEVGRSQKAQRAWEDQTLTTEKNFWEQERKN